MPRAGVEVPEGREHRRPGRPEMRNGHTDPDLRRYGASAGLVRPLRKAGMKSDAGRGCGVHIHIGAKGHTPQTIRNLVNIMASHESQIAKAIKVDAWRQSRYCRTVDPRFLEQVNKKKPKTMSQLADVWYKSQHCDYGRSHHYNDSRYHMLNLHATFTKHMIEFRLFQFDAPSDGKQNGPPRRAPQGDDPALPGHEPAGQAGPLRKPQAPADGE